MTLTNITLKPISIHSQACLSAEDETHRYHIWLDDNFVPFDVTVYKNAKGENDKPRSHTIRLNRTIGLGKKIATVMLAHVTPKTMLAWHAERNRMIDKEKAEHEAARLHNLKRSNAGVMFDALTEIVKNDPYNQSSAGIIARRAIADIK